MSTESNLKHRRQNPDSAAAALPVHSHSLARGRRVDVGHRPAIIRERHRLPIPGSSIKGVLRDACRNDRTRLAERIFGKQEDAGRLTFIEGRFWPFPCDPRRLLCLCDCPLALGGSDASTPNSTRCRCCHHGARSQRICAARSAVTLTRNHKTGVVLEVLFHKAWATPGCSRWKWRNLLGLLNDPVWSVAQGRFVLLSNGDFSISSATHAR